MNSARVVLALAIFCLFASVVTAGEVEVTPYGFVLVNSGYNTNIPTDIPVLAPATPDDAEENGTYLITARQTRFGLKATTEAEGWKATGIVELDFWGRKGSGAPAASMQSAPRLRLANFRMSKENVTLVFGQDWSCFAPLLPTSLAHQSVVVFSSSGNIWNRMPQIRFDYKSPAGESGHILVQVAAVRPIAADVTDAGQGETLGAGEYSSLPFGQARVAFLGETVSIGGSVHFGQEDWFAANNGVITIGTTDFALADEKTNTWGVAGDVKVDAGAVGFSGEAYTGSNLKMLFSNAFVRPVPTGSSLAAAEEYEIEGVDVMGGWGQIALTPKDAKVAFHAGAGVEILDEDQVQEMANDLASTPIYKNLTAFGNVFYTPIPKVTLALEIAYIKTTYKMQESAAAADSDSEIDGDNINVNAAFKFAF